MKNKIIALLVTGSIFCSTHTLAQDPNWVRDNTWYFDNFVKDTLPWTIFRETFIGVAPQPSGDFDQLFYSQIYQTKIAGPGHCYGMDVMAMMMMKNGGYLGYCHPPYMYSGTIASNSAGPGNPSNDSIGPTDPNLKTAIEIAHGNQITHSFLSFLLDAIAISKNRDGRYAYQQAEYYLAKNDPPIVSITENLSPADGGHVLIPFFVQNLVAKKRIYVYDPNRSFYKPGLDGHDFYTMDSNYIEINSASGAWKYNMGSSANHDDWKGDPGSGGNCIIVPLSIAGKKDRLPQSLLAEGAYAINTIFIFGDVQVEQITDPVNKRHLLNKQGTDWETNKKRRLTNILPFIPMGGAGTAESKKTAIYFVRGQRRLSLQLRPYGDYRIGMLFGGRYAELKGFGDGSSQFFLTPDLLHKEKPAIKKSLSQQSILTNPLR
ncbi:MAG TPA: hypothetical protein VK645_13110 [Chitinophagaceae bacterium]|nr:hypothetical protein [Chitinophagaceae bacterium]